jgi:molybdopterin-containing oxidoreductase family iron-sulfur binding subunit
MKRRTFLKMAGLGSIAFAVGCGSETDKRLYSLVKAPDDLVTGKADYYASVCRECPAGCGILVKNREGRAIKIEGNPLHPVNRGRLCMRGQAALQAVYHPDRLRRPLLREGTSWRAIDFAEAENIVGEKAAQLAQHGAGRVRMLTETVGESLFSLFSDGMTKWRSDPPQVYEPLGYHDLKRANGTVFGRSELASYRMGDADLLLSFGADFLETWLSPVAYARLFKRMHAFDGKKKGRFYHVGPYQSLTAANADRWLCCPPGTEAVLALGLLREMLRAGRGRDLPGDLAARMLERVSDFTPEGVCSRCGIDNAAYHELTASLSRAKRPLVLGPGAAAWSDTQPVAHLAANLLNLVLDPKLSLLDFSRPHRIDAAPVSDIIAFVDELNRKPPSLLILNRVNPVYSLPPGVKVEKTLTRSDMFVVCITPVMDDTARNADLVIPVRHSLESWDEYSNQGHLWGILQPTLAPETRAPGLGDLFLRLMNWGGNPHTSYKSYVKSRLRAAAVFGSEGQWLEAVGRGGVFDAYEGSLVVDSAPAPDPLVILDALDPVKALADSNAKDPAPIFLAAPSIRFFDGRGGNRPWLCEVPDPLTKVAWQTPVLMHPETLAKNGLAHEAVVRIKSQWGEISATAYETEGVHPGVVAMSMGQGHQHYTRYASGQGVNPAVLLSPGPTEKAPVFLSAVGPVSLKATGRSARLAQTAGSRIQHGRKIALSVVGRPAPERALKDGHGGGFGMNEFPFTLPLPQGYSPERDFFPPHGHEGYRWAMVVDLDRCIGCSACAAACYAENNLGVVGEKHILEGREMAWLQVQRYHDMKDARRIIFLPMMCQQCDNAPCESVCPVYAPHHSKEGLNNQIYNRCIGTRFCSQNCPYKVRRFNWFDWKWPKPLDKQLNPEVTVRSKGVMEKCSFCVQRIKQAHGVAKNEGRPIGDGEVRPACVQTCPTNALVFGNLMDPRSRVRHLVDDTRAYQVMGYLNTKPAVIYLKKVVELPYV